MNPTKLVAIVLLVAGVLGLVYGGFSYTKNTTAVKLGPIELAVKEKEYVALGIAVAQRCAPCIGFHVEALMKAGATRAELGDVLAMSVQMGGGPALMYAAQALACWDELAAA